MFMAKAIIFLVISITLIFLEQLASAEVENHFIYNGFEGATDLQLDGNAILLPSGVLQLTNTTKQITGHAFHRLPLSLISSSFSTVFVIAMFSKQPDFFGHGMAFVISPSTDFSHAVASSHLGLFNTSNNGLSSNHVFAVEFDTVKSPEFQDIDDNHVGIDVNNITSILSASATYYTNGRNKTLELINGDPIQVWIEYDQDKKLLTVSLAPMNAPKPILPLLSTEIDFSKIFSEKMYVGFSASTGTITSDHYVLGWSFSKSGRAQNLDIQNLPSVPPHGNTKKVLGVGIKILIIISALILAIGLFIAGFKIWKRCTITLEDWEENYGPQRFSFNNLHKSTRGFSINELLGSGGFGNVYRGELSSTKKKIAVKRISRCSEQGLQQFVAEIVSMGRLKHRNLVQLYGYCRRGRELILVYDYMPNGSVDMYLFSNEKPNLSWFHRFKILRDVASALLYLHEEWEQVVLHRDVKASNVMLDADMNGRLGDFGLAKFYDHGATTETTNVVGTVGYIAPELATTGIPTTSTDVFALGAFMLEMACGRKAREIRASRDKIVLLDWVATMFRRGNILQTCDPKLAGNYVLEEMELILRLGLLCSHSDPAVRPSARQVTQYLAVTPSGDVIIPDIPQNIGGIAPPSMSSLVALDQNTSFTSSFEVDSDMDSILYIGR